MSETPRERKSARVDMHHVPTLGLSIMDAFAVVAPRYGVRLEGLDDDANEHSNFWQQVAEEIIGGPAHAR